MAHYLIADLQSRVILISLKRVKGAYTSENIAKAILQVINKFRIANKVGYFQANNAKNNDTYV
jgi:hypothetical protein